MIRYLLLILLAVPALGYEPYEMVISSTTKKIVSRWQTHPGTLTCDGPINQCRDIAEQAIRLNELKEEHIQCQTYSACEALVNYYRYMYEVERAMRTLREREQRRKERE